MDRIDFNDHVAEDIDWESEEAKLVLAKAPEPGYGTVAQLIRQGVPADGLCAMFCGGKKCKYCHCDHPWHEDQMAIKGLYSNWITDNILAMARPCTRGVQKHDIIKQFTAAGIRSVINTQTPGEHAHCGDGLEDAFSYRPELFMENDIYCYNFAMPDYNVGTVQSLVDMVRVMQFAVSQGKVAVHCHAGLGRTGVMIASYLIFNNRMKPDEAIHYVRSKRPKAIQTSTQIDALRNLDEYLYPFRIIYSEPSKSNIQFTLSQFVGRQKHVLHGYEARVLKFIPKIIYVCCERLKELALNTHNEAIHGEVVETRRTLSIVTNLVADDVHDETTTNDCESETSENGLDSSNASDVNEEMAAMNLDSCTVKFDARVYSVAHAMSIIQHSVEVVQAANKLMEAVNQKEEAWIEISDLTDPCILCELIWRWLDHLQEAAITLQNVNIMLQHLDDAKAAFMSLDRAGRHTSEYLLRIVAKLQPMPDEIEDLIMLRLIAVLTHHNIYLDPERTPPDLPNRTNSTRVLKGERLHQIIQLFYERLDQIELKLKVKQLKKRS